MPEAPRHEAFRQAIDQAIAEAPLRRSLRLQVECRSEAGMRRFRALGHGVAVWNGATQFALSDQEIVSLLVQLREGGFVRLDTRYGGEPARELPPPGSAQVMTCRVFVALGHLERQSIQLARGEQSPELKRLAEALLDFCAPRARTGVTARSLDDGLEKLATGELDAETLLVVWHRKPVGETSSEGLLLRIVGRQVEAWSYRSDRGYTDGRRLELSAADIEQLANELFAAGPGRLPDNFWSPDFIDLRLQVLDQERSIQARPSRGITRDEGAEEQRSFELLLAALESVHQKVSNEGDPLAPARAID